MGADGHVGVVAFGIDFGMLVGVVGYRYSRGGVNVVYGFAGEGNYFIYLVVGFAGGFFWWIFWNSGAYRATVLVG